MLWVTRAHIRVNRAATGWLIRRFIDPRASFRFVEPDQVVRIQRDCHGIGFDAPGARYPHKDEIGRCSFEVLVAEYRPHDTALRMLAGIVHRADFPEELAWRNPRTLAWQFDVLSQVAPESSAVSLDDAPGLRSISRGFPLVAADDHETLERCAFLYDSLYASLREQLGYAAQT
jgi:hypothetical protein